MSIQLFLSKEQWPKFNRGCIIDPSKTTRPRGMSKKKRGLEIKMWRQYQRWPNDSINVGDVVVGGIFGNKKKPPSPLTMKEHLGLMQDIISNHIAYYHQYFYL